MPYCGNCGHPVGVKDNFCPSCGNKLVPVAAGGEPSGSPAAVLIDGQSASPAACGSPETLTAIIPDLKERKTLRTDTYYLMITCQRSIFIKLTTVIQQKAAQFNLEKNPGQNKSLMSRWKAQVAGPNIYLQYLNALGPEGSLSLSHENSIMDNRQISQVKCTFYYHEDEPSEWYVDIESQAEKRKLVTVSNPEKLLKTAYAGKFSK